jgi:hypothetical protein
MFYGKRVRVPVQGMEKTFIRATGLSSVCAKGSGYKEIFKHSRFSDSMEFVVIF